MSGFWSTTWGDVATLMGLLLAFAGFLRAAGAAEAARAAAERARQAVERSRRDQARFTAGTELQVAIGLVNEVGREVRRSTGSSVTPELEELATRARDCIIGARTTLERLGAKDVWRLASALTALKDSVEPRIGDSQEDELRGRLWEVSTMLTGLRAELQSTVGAFDADE